MASLAKATCRRNAGLFANTYSLSSIQEYWAEGVQDWYDTNSEAIPSNGIHNQINTRSELSGYDNRLYKMVSELLPDNTKFSDCHHR